MRAYGGQDPVATDLQKTWWIGCGAGGGGGHGRVVVRTPVQPANAAAAIHPAPAYVPLKP